MKPSNSNKNPEIEIGDWTVVVKATCMWMVCNVPPVTAEYAICGRQVGKDPLTVPYRCAKAVELVMTKDKLGDVKRCPAILKNLMGILTPSMIVVGLHAFCRLHVIKISENWFAVGSLRDIIHREQVPDSIWWDVAAAQSLVFLKDLKGDMHTQIHFTDDFNWKKIYGARNSSIE